MDGRFLMSETPLHMRMMDRIKSLAVCALGLGRFQAKMAHVMRSRPDSGRGLQVEFLKTLKGVSSTLGSVWGSLASQLHDESSSSSSLLSLQVLEGP